MHNYHWLVPSHENSIVDGSFRNLILTLIVTAEQNIWIIQYHAKNFFEKIGPSGAQYYFCFNLYFFLKQKNSLIKESYLEYQYILV